MENKKDRRNNIEEEKKLVDKNLEKNKDSNEIKAHNGLKKHIIKHCKLFNQNCLAKKNYNERCDKTSHEKIDIDNDISENRYKCKTVIDNNEDTTEYIENYWNISHTMKRMNVHKNDTIFLFPALKDSDKEDLFKLSVPDIIFVI